MLHHFDGLGEREADMDWTGAEGRAQKGTAPPEVRSVISIAEEVPEVEPGFNAFRAELVEHFTYESGKGGLVWFSRGNKSHLFMVYTATTVYLG